MNVLTEDTAYVKKLILNKEGNYKDGTKDLLHLIKLKPFFVPHFNKHIASMMT